MLEIKNLYKKYGGFLALNCVNLRVPDGELFGFVGANGAGKTTTMRICVGLLREDSGEVLIDGKNMLTDVKALHNKVGYVPDFFGAYGKLSCTEYLEFFASTYGIRGSEANKLCGDLLRLVKLSHKAEADVNSLSRGMKQRLCLARGLVHNPDILFLDEPASGLDPQARYELKEILRSLSSMGKTIVISSHILPELAEMCTSIGIIDQGHIVLSGTMDEIHQASSMSSPLLITVDQDFVEQTFIALQEIPQVQKVTAQGNKLIVSFSGNRDEERDLLKHLLNQSIPIEAFTRSEGSLENLFMQIVGKRTNPKRRG